MMREVVGRTLTVEVGDIIALVKVGDGPVNSM